MNGLRVLVAEGNPTYMATLRHVLAGSSRVAAAVETAQGCQVVEAARSEQPDVALLDVHLPGSGGLAVARELRQKVPGVKIILLLSDDGASYRMAANEIGARWLAKDRLVEELPTILDALSVDLDGWNGTGGKGNLDRINIDVTFGSARGAALTSISAEDWREGMLKALRPALIIFLIGIALLGLTAAMAWNPYLSVERDSTGGSRIVDDLGLFGQPGAIVELNRGQTDAYVAARTEMHRDNLLICLAVGVLGLGAGSILIAWSQLKDEKSLSGNHSRTKRVASSE